MPHPTGKQEAGPRAAWSKRYRFSINLTLGILFAVLVCITQWVSYLVSRDLLDVTVHEREIDKINTLSKVIENLIRLQTARVGQIAMLLTHSDDLARQVTLPPAEREAAIAASVDKAARIIDVDILEVIDDREVIVHCSQDPGRKGAIATTWGVAEALAGKGLQSSVVDPRGLAIRATEPLRVQGRVVGALAVGLRLSNQFIQMLSADTGAELVLLSRSAAPLAASASFVGKIDTQAVTEAFHQKIPIYRQDAANRRTQVYLPMMIIDDAFVMLAQLDSGQAHMLLERGSRRSALYAAVILACSILVVGITLHYVLRPLRRLMAYADKTAVELTGEEIRSVHRNEAAAVAQVLETLTDRLVHRNQELAEANLKLQELDRMKSEFISSVSHELRTPLTSVWGFAKLIRRDLAKASSPMSANHSPMTREELLQRSDRNLEIITSESARLTVMINNLLDLAKIESGTVAWNDQPLDPAWIAGRATAAAAGIFEQHPEVALTLNVAPDLPPVLADPDRLEQVLLNLLANAGKFTPEGTVELCVARVGSGVRFSVRDEGIGIPENELRLIFGQFYQVAHGITQEAKPQGTGLGLSISSSILAHYGSQIQVESEPGRGSTFFFDLPEAPATMV